MRNEISVRELYKQYCYRYALAKIDEEDVKKEQFFGASFALGRVLNKDMKKIEKDYDAAVYFIQRLREEGKELPGYREV